MSRSKQYLVSLLESVPITELSDFEHRSAFDQIKSRIAEAEDVVGELKVLYRVNNFSDFALNLLWIAEKVERDPSMLESTPEEQNLTLEAFRRAMGDTGEGVGTAASTMPAEEISTEPTAETPSGFGFESTTEVPTGFPSEPEPTLASDLPVESSIEQAPESMSVFGPTSEPSADAMAGFGPTSDQETTADSMAGFGPPSESMTDFPSAPSLEPTLEPMADFPSFEQPGAEMPAAPASAGEGGAEAQFAKLVEQFVEAVQTGAENRDAMKEQVLSACAAVLSEGSGATEDYRNFSQVFTEFINYIFDNQLVDDIRVMNLLSNVTDPVWAWARADEAGRAGMMNAAYDVLRDYKSLFE